MSSGPPMPSYIFRGHESPVHALQFYQANELLVSGDSDGWIVIWSLATKRSVAVWKGHEGGIMCLEEWQPHRLISHGRDHKLRVWQLRSDDHEGMSTRLPVDGADAAQSKQPWLLHSLSVNALNYCAFSACEANDNKASSRDEPLNESLLLAAPNGLDAGGIDIFHLPSEHRVCKLPSDKELQTGMVMAVALFHHPVRKELVLASGYESGHVLLHSNKDPSGHEWAWIKVMMVQQHSQPVLSINTTADGVYFFSASADATIAKFSTEHAKLEKKIDSRHAGQQGLSVRDDAKICATAGWDKRIRVYSVKTLKELAVLKWHQEGCYATAFARTVTQADHPRSDLAEGALIGRAVDIIRDREAAKLLNIHWLAAGGKDGKISLWNIY